MTASCARAWSVLAVIIALVCLARQGRGQRQHQRYQRLRQVFPQSHAPRGRVQVDEIFDRVDALDVREEDLVEAKTDYSKYRVIKIFPSEDDRWKVVQQLDGMVDFWTNPMESNSTVDILVSPVFFRDVKYFLDSNQIPMKITFRNLQSAIDYQQFNEVEQPQLRRKSKHAKQYSLRRRDRVSPNPQPSMISRFLGLFFGRPYRPESRRIPRKIKGGDAFILNSIDSEPAKPKKVYPEMNWRRYHRLGTIYQFMRSLERKYPDLVKVFSIGQTFDGRDTLVAKLGKAQNYQKPAIFIEGGIHAREWISPATVTFIMRQMVENYQLNRDILDFYDVYVLPVMNPDGYEYTHTTDRLWRKNRSRSKSGIGLSNILSACAGVDLNRNFGFHWADPSINHIRGGTQLQCLETYQGPGPFSEPESKNVRDFVNARKHLIVLYMTFHSYGQKVLYPWSYTAEKVYDWRELDRLGKIMSEAIFKESRGRFAYEVGSSPRIQYTASGGSDDWAKGGAGIKWVYLIELPDRGRHSFLLPSREILPVARSAMAAFRVAAAEISYTLVR